MIPRRTVTYLTGDGGGGKSLLAEQLSVAASTGTDWIGTLPEKGPVLFLTAEDEEAELHRRLVDIVGARGMSLADLDDMHVLSLAGEDALLSVSAGRSGGMTPTPLWNELVRRIDDLAPILIVLDTQADLFGGNEISRSDVRSFIAMLRGLAQAQDAAVVLLGHPSLTGMSSGSGLSGSTAWNNSVRSRLYLDKVKGDDGDEVDPDLRVLRVMKSNYGPAGAEIRLRWQAGAFKLDGGGTTGFQRIAIQATAETTFLDLLATFNEQGREVSDKTGRNYAPHIFAQTPSGRPIGKRAFGSAMERLFKDGKIKVDKWGPPSKPKSKIVAS